MSGGWPVQCRRCGGTYDLGTVTITARYADCSVWKAPCCGTTHDDRFDWGSGTRRRCYDEIAADLDACIARHPAGKGRS